MLTYSAVGGSEKDQKCPDVIQETYIMLDFGIIFESIFGGHFRPPTPPKTRRHLCTFPNGSGRGKKNLLIESIFSLIGTSFPNFPRVKMYTLNNKASIILAYDFVIDLVASYAPALKMFLKPVWEGKMHGVTKIGIFRPYFCVNMLGK